VEVKILLSPYEPLPEETGLSLSVSGDVLTVNGEELDFGPLPEGAVLPSEAIGNDYVIGAERQNGELGLTLRFPVRSDASEQARFPQPLTVSAGRVELPT
jgi:hypothetical protein